MEKSQVKYCVSFAGFDPSAGAGLLADVKSMEATGVYGMGVCTALTVQNDVDFIQCEWQSIEFIKTQFETLATRFYFSAAKIGLVQDVEMVQEIVTILKKHNPLIHIVWDPILSASAGFKFDNFSDFKSIELLCKEIELLTPNLIEAERLFGEELSNDIILEKCNSFSILVKGGHSDDIGKDLLFHKGQLSVVTSEFKYLSPKHGTGCVLSSVICSFLAQGFGLLESCNKGKRYIEDFMSSNETLLGWHGFSEN